MKKRRKKRRKLSSHSDSIQNFDENSKNPEPDTNTSSKSPDTELNVAELKREISHGTNESCDERATDNSEPKSKSPEMHYNKTKVKTTRFGPPQTSSSSSTIIKRASNLVKQMDKMDEDFHDDNDEEIKQQQGTMRLKKIRLTPRTDSTNTSNNLQQMNVTESGVPDTGDQATEIPLPLSRERMISLCTISKDELGCYLPPGNDDTEDNSQDQETELMQIFQAEGKTNNQQMINNNNNFNNNCGNTQNSSIPVLENYQIQYSNNNNSNITSSSNLNHNQMRHQMSQQNKISELRNMLEQNLMPGPNDPNLGASGTLALLSQRHTDVTLRHQMQGYASHRKVMPNFTSSTRKNTFVPIPTGPGLATQMTGNRPVETSPFVSPRATPIAKTKRNHNLPPLQMLNPKIVPVIGAHNTAFTRPTHFKQEGLPASAPSSPSLSGTFRYYSGQPANTASTIYRHPAELRSQSVPLHQQPQDDYTSAYSSACNSVNPTPVPSEFHDFDEQQNNLLEMFSSESGVMPNIKMETTDFVSTDFLDTDEVSSTIDMNELLPDSSKSLSLISRSVPNTPLPYNNNHFNNNNTSSSSSSMKDTNLTCVNNNIHINGGKYPQSVPTTPVPAGCAFRYTPPTTRDYLINGYNNQIEQKISEKVEQSQALAANSSFMNEQNIGNFQTGQVSNSDPIIEGDIFNEIA